MERPAGDGGAISLVHPVFAGCAIARQDGEGSAAGIGFESLSANGG
ncbi:MAG: hypothetical protein J0L78_04355 [Planctomycetes bacterium]|nr:hypothetical protein [Planctomycetota bacterium]